MGQILVKVNGRDYPIACDDGGEDRVRAIGQYVDEKVRELVGQVGQAGDARLMLLAALNLGDELAAAYDEVEVLRNAPPREVPSPELVAKLAAETAARETAEAAARGAHEAAEIARQQAALAEDAQARAEAATQAWIAKCEDLAKRLAEHEARAGAAHAEAALAKQRVAAFEAENVERDARLAAAERRALEAEAQATASAVRAGELERFLVAQRARVDEEDRQREALAPLLARIERLADSAAHAA
ncbi:MAG: cell division protein ZapA [Tagaea sp.]